MREKRRSTGVVYLGDTKESGSEDSDDDDKHINNDGYKHADDDGGKTIRNTQHNEISNNSE